MTSFGEPDECPMHATPRADVGDPERRGSYACQHLRPLAGSARTTCGTPRGARCGRPRVFLGGVQRLVGVRFAGPNRLPIALWRAIRIPLGSGVDMHIAHVGCAPNCDVGGHGSWSWHRHMTRPIAISTPRGGSQHVLMAAAQRRLSRCPAGPKPWSAWVSVERAAGWPATQRRGRRHRQPPAAASGPRRPRAP
jgi:hypothetical protein